MIAAWMLYTLVAGAVLGVAAHLCERGLALLDRPARWPWLAAIFTTVLWPLMAASMLGHSAFGGLGSRGADDAEVASTDTAGGAGIGLRVVNDLPAGIPDAWLLIGWASSSTLVLVIVLVGTLTLHRGRRHWRPGVVAGERVLLSHAIGPAVIGTVRPRIVVPGWVLELDEPTKRLIVLHEREHLRAGDSRLLGAALLLLILLPWCLPLWWHLRRLRFAMETACDRHLLRAGAPARAYAEALLAVARGPSLHPLAAMASSKAGLERRIRLIVRRPSPRSVRLALVPIATAALLPLVGSVAVPAPAPPSAAILSAVFPGATGMSSEGLEATPHGAVGEATESIEPVLEALADGSLPGDPGEEGLLAALASHHADAIAVGIPAGSIVWFVVDSAGIVRHTGIELGAEGEVAAQIRARYPAETSDFLLAFDAVPTDGGDAHVLWMLPAP